MMIRRILASLSPVCTACIALACSRAPTVNQVPSSTPPTPTLPEKAATSTATATAVPVASALPSSPATAWSVDALAFKTAKNMEMVPYCLPYPSAYLPEDFSERWEHGHKVFTRKLQATDDKKSPPARMEFQGSCGPRSLKELYEADRKAIIAEVSEKAMTMSVLRDKSYVLSWRKNDRIHYGKMWIAANDPGCFVRATFDYDNKEREIFDTIIGKVAAADPTCPKDAP